MHTSRRSLVSGAIGAGALAGPLAGAAAGAMASTPAAAGQAPAPTAADDQQEAAAAYAALAGFRDLRAGGQGDEACGAWMEAHLRAHGYAVTRQSFQTPFFEPTVAELRVGNAQVPVVPQAVVTVTGPDGVSGPLRVWRDQADTALMAGAVALLILPHGRHSQLAAQPILTRVRQVAVAGAAAIVLVTTGPTGESLALNADPEGPPVPIPMAVIGSRAAQPLLELARSGARATLVLTGDSGYRPAFNLAGRIDRPGPRLVISTPRSGWGPCMGERGPGIAAFRILTAWAPVAFPDQAISVVVTSGHEYDNLGGHIWLRDGAPPPGDTRLWVHLGAGFAARDWHEFGAMLGPLMSADPQRVLMGTPDLVAPLRSAFAGLPGLEATYPSTLGAAGELGEVLRAGYPRAFGMFGAHRFHHAASDDIEKVDPAFIPPVTAALRRAIQALLPL